MTDQDRQFYFIGTLDWALVTGASGSTPIEAYRKVFQEIRTEYWPQLFILAIDDV